MKRILLLSLLFPIALCAQFSQPVKDSVFSVLKYNSARYSITLGMQTADYVPASDTGFKNLSKDELLEKVTGSPADAPLYGAIAINAYYRDKDITTANQYIPRALGAYQEWINAEPANPTPVEKLLSFCLSINNYTAIPGLLDYALPRFPKHLPLLQQAAFYYLFGAGNTDKSQQVLNEAFAIAPGNITNLVYQTSIHQHRALADMGAGRTPHFPPIKQLDDALQAEPGNIALEHTDHYYRLSRIYFTGIARALKVNTDDLLVFNYFQLSETEKQYLDESAKWFSRQAKKKQANQYTLLHTLGVISCMQQEYDKASSFFEQAIRIKKDGAGLQALALTQYFQQQYPAMKETVQQKIALEQHPDDYSTLLWLYRKKLNDSAAELQLLLHLASLKTEIPANNETLVTGYLLTGQNEKAKALLPRLTGSGAGTWALKTIAAVLLNEEEQARNMLQQLLEKYPTDEQAVQLKKFITNP